MADPRVMGLSFRSWMLLARWTVFGTLGCIAIAVAFNSVYFGVFAPDALREALVSATVIPVLLAGPLFFYLTLKLRELAIANHRLRILASTDSLTHSLNRGAFTDLVDGHLERRSADDGVQQGAMLVIDADHFKSINDRFGHHRGDEALRIIADSIRTSLRTGDLFGRLGGEEFGVFLPNVSPGEATTIAERIRRNVQEAEFSPNGEHRVLTVSVGGASFERRLNFGELFRMADECLYTAKSTGRDRVEMIFVPAYGGEWPATVH